MAANAQELPPAQQQAAAEQAPSLALALVPQAQALAQIKPTRVSLSYEEISKLFSLPIAEAASILGNHAHPVSSDVAGIRSFRSRLLGTDR